MANLEIAQIQNVALKAAAIEVDEFGKQDGYIDSSEINIFKNKATALLIENKCTQQEFDTLFPTNEVDKTNTTDVFAKVDSLHNAKNTPEALAKEVTDVFAKVDSLHNAKNTPEALAKEAEEVKRAEKQEKIDEIKAEIAENDKKLKLYGERLAQKDIAWNTYLEDFPSKFDRAIFSIAKIGLVTTVLGGMAGIMLAECAPIIMVVGAVVMAASMLVKTAKEGYYENNQYSPEIQEKIRNDYKDAYLKVSQDNEELKAQLAELQK